MALWWEKLDSRNNLTVVDLRLDLPTASSDDDDALSENHVSSIGHAALRRISILDTDIRTTLAAQNLDCKGRVGEFFDKRQTCDQHIDASLHCTTFPLYLSKVSFQSPPRITPPAHQITQITQITPPLSPWTAVSTRPLLNAR
jgi:hypothetical protein